MAAFPYQELPFLVDCVIPPEMMINLSSSSSSSTTTTTTNSPLLSPFENPIFEQLQFQYPFENLVANPTDFNLHESSCVEQGGTPMAEKESTVQNIGGWVPVKNKRKVRGDGSSPNPSKEVRGGRSKKQRKCKNEGVKKEEEDEKKDKIKEAPKGYIHVRARRGQATDSHSLAERVRREKISERMKFLQSLVPGCDKVTGKATMLEEIINYVQSLQSQVEFLSMKLSSVSPMVYSFGMDLDALLVEQQGLNNMTPTTTIQTPPVAPATTDFTTSSVGAPMSFQQQMKREANPPCLEDNVFGSLYWGLRDQGGHDPISQPGFNNLMHSF